ncbi:MAG: hypothetical protein K0S23_2378 [Fluviicola sp.]|jgi:hypothetical protein|uniref:hypothetical protein n=1 Tax=Fluviicola sp. TaxID=1917219 RepID=UPI00261613C1|nr:hypothetical protein [Fluviicola sp.]MDF3028071.1 hypothetical protein [Fluviicola sp.]
MKGTFFCGLLIAFFSPLAGAQNLSKEFQQIYSKLDQLKTFQFIVDYSSNDTLEFSEKGKVNVLFTPDGYFYQTAFCEMVINREHTIIINDEDHQILYSKNENLDRTNKSVTTGMLLNQIDTLVTKADSIYFSFDGLDRVYYLRFANQYFNLVELRFTGEMLRQIDYYYNADFVGNTGLMARNEITFIENPEYDARILRTDFYFVEKNKTMIPTEEFSLYRIQQSESTNSILE